MPETTPLIKAALNLRGGAGFDVYFDLAICKYYTVYSQPYIFKMNKNKYRIHLTNTTDIKGGKNEKKIS